MLRDAAPLRVLKGVNARLRRAMDARERALGAAPQHEGRRGRRGLAKRNQIARLSQEKDQPADVENDADRVACFPACSLQGLAQRKRVSRQGA